MLLLDATGYLNFRLSVLFFSAEGKCPLVGIACYARYDDDNDDLSRPFDRPENKEISLLQASERECVK